MKSISIYTITRNQSTECLQKMERQLSGRERFLKIREWELESMKSLVEQLERQIPEVYELRFFYSFQIPRLGKEFDLLQIREEQIVNIELKSGQVSDEAIRKQLIQNRYYLSVLGRPIQSYTYISSQNRLVRLTNHDHVVAADWEQLCMELQKGGSEYEGDIEDLFRAELYLISPLTEPERFLRKEYFLTSQQREIERQILKKIRAKRSGYFWFTGLPGTGKTLLLYDIAMKLSSRQKVCMIHCGEAGMKWKILHERLQRIDFVSDREIALNSRISDDSLSESDKEFLLYGEKPLEGQLELDGHRKSFSSGLSYGKNSVADQGETQIQWSQYSAILVDEAHLLSEKKLEYLLEKSGQRPVIFSSDSEEMISPKEIDRSVMKNIGNLQDLLSFHLTNRIRTNAELSSFIQNMMHLPKRRSQKGYPHIKVVYANDEREAENLLKAYTQQGYQYRDSEMQKEITTSAISEVERLVVLIDERYYYDETYYLRSKIHDTDGKSDVRSLFHQLNLAKENLALVVKGNETVYERVLELLQVNRIK
nr:DNA/RNA helicase domain-containing protein [uncultured Mediterraneibacter sp.]